LDLLQGQVAITDVVGEGALLTEDGSSLLTESGSEIIVSNDSVVYGGQPFVFLSISKDGGQTYGYEMRSPMGNIGQRTFRTVWRKLGTTPRGQGFVPRIQFFNQSPFVILGAAWDFEVLPE